MTFPEKYKWLLPGFVFTGLLIIARVIYTGTITFLFLPWNLFLAVIPLYFSYKLRAATGKPAVALLAAWLLFFPNSMYIITDLFHLEERSVPLWYDLIILFSSATLGVIVGYLSVLNVERYLVKYVKRATIPLIMLLIFLLCGYGIYLGRYQRWNSWDIIVQPISLAKDMAQGVIHPFRNIECWLLTMMFGTWLYILHFYFRRLKWGSNG